MNHLEIDLMFDEMAIETACKHLAWVLSRYKMTKEKILELDTPEVKCVHRSVDLSKLESQRDALLDELDEINRKIRRAEENESN